LIVAVDEPGKRNVFSEGERLRGEVFVFALTGYFLGDRGLDGGIGE